MLQLIQLAVLRPQVCEVDLWVKRRPCRRFHKLVPVTVQAAHLHTTLGH